MNNDHIDRALVILSERGDEGFQVLFEYLTPDEVVDVWNYLAIVYADDEWAED